MTLLVKICGLTRADALDAAVGAGADAIGFVFHPSSPRNLSPKRAAALAGRLPRGVLAVAVTHHPEPEDVLRVLEAFRPDAWQTDAEDFIRLRLPRGIARWPVLRRLPANPRTIPARVMFDAAQSGRGRLARWGDAKLIAGRRELILGGGLDADNVARAIEAVGPFGVDVSSGVESSPGVKDRARIRAFIAAARSAESA